MARWLQVHQARLVVLDVLSTADRGEVLLLAHDLAAEGGPAVLVASFGENETLRQDFFRHYYGQIIHDVPLDHACFVNWTDIGYGRLAMLGNQATVTYTTSADLTALRQTPPRAATIISNELRGTHFVAVKLGEWDEQLGRRGDYVDAATLTERAVEGILAVVRRHLDEVSSILEPGTGLPLSYRFGPNNAGSGKGLARALYRLAVIGRRLYSAAFTAKTQQQSEGCLQAEKQTIHLAPLASIR